jgi:release factor glutamine methyltransferase
MRDQPMDLNSWLREATGRLAEAGVPSPRADGEHLAGHLLHLGRGELVAAAVRGRRLEAGEIQALEDLLIQREQRVPLQHLTGIAAFRSLDLSVGPGVFIPRPETEVVAAAAIDELVRVIAVRSEPVVVDLCTGSGAIALAVAVEVPQARVLAVERDPMAVAWAQRNVAALAPRVVLSQGDVADPILDEWAGQVDVVVANPPYIPQTMRPIDPEVHLHDPDMALYGGGEDGLRVPALVVSAAERLLRPGGLLVMEHGDAQGAGARRLCRAPVWGAVSTLQDLTGRDRALVARRTEIEVPR